MRERVKNINRSSSIGAKLLLMVLVVVIPLLTISLFLISSLNRYSLSYDAIVKNMTIANDYNMNFKEEMDESLYLMVARDIPAGELGNESEVANPYDLINELSDACQQLLKITRDSQSRSWLLRLSRNVDTLENRVDDIGVNLEAGGKYDANIEMLENNIYILTELIQDDIQYYIYYQTQSIESLKNELNEEVSRFIFIVSIILIGVLATGTILATIILRGVVVPVKNLVEVTEHISEGDFSIRAKTTTRDEIGMLSLAVNEMTEHLETMVNTIKEDERRMRHAELRLLQEQINPHFLYNTLDTIVWLIESDKAEEAEDMVVSLSSFFRLVLSHGHEFITIAEEERHIKSYLEIQQVRYKDILQYDIDIDEQIHHVKILKLTLQPIVENALYHGIKYKRAMGTIKVRGSLEDDMVVLTVEDDGVGMDEAELASLQTEIQKPCQDTNSGFGLANVNERIRMNFGPSYGISIESEVGVGTKVKIVIPASVAEVQQNEEQINE